jgi:uncharacterized membrane protein YsdA (DUF1294 family)
LTFGAVNTNRPKYVNRSQRGRLGVSAIAVLGVLLVMPITALSRFSPPLDWRVLGLPAAVSIVAFFVYRSDKRSAEAGEWRISESTLHLIALIGGWPGAFLGQRVFRHKTSKLSFQIVFWLVVFLHQFAAIDSLLNWRFTKEATRAIRSQSAF